MRAEVLNADSAGELAGTDYAGIVGRFPPLRDHPVRRFVENSDKPVVTLSLDYAEHTDWLRYPEDSAKIGEVAAGCLLRRPVRSFLFVSGEGATHEARWSAFSRALRTDPRPRVRHKECGFYRNAAVTLATVLSRLPKPVGVFGSVDSWARLAVEVGEESGMVVPEELCVVGFGNREFESRLTSTPISTIGIDHEGWAYAATGLLLEAIRGEAPPGTVRTFPPGELIERFSTQGTTNETRLGEKALALARNHPDRFTGIKALSENLGVSKAVLERAFSGSFGCGVAEKLLEARLDLAKSMLASGANAKAVAAIVGFASYRGFSKAFRRCAGCAPADYRKMFEKS